MVIGCHPPLNPLIVGNSLRQTNMLNLDNKMSFREEIGDLALLCLLFACAGMPSPWCRTNHAALTSLQSLC